MQLKPRKHSLLFVTLASTLTLSQDLFAADSPRGGSVEDSEGPSFADIAPIVEANCTPCHSSSYPAGDIALETEADFTANKVKVEAAVTSGYMPYGQPEWKDSAEGQLFLEWLKARAE